MQSEVKRHEAASVDFASAPAADDADGLCTVRQFDGSALRDRRAAGGRNPRADGDDAAATDTSALIWYRYGDEPMLAAERRTVSRLPNEPYETALLRLLLEGPSLDAPALRGLFPAGTRVISTSRQGKMLFVTLSYQLMNGYSDEPSNWRSDTAWAKEVPLRRRLAMQAIAATVTENTTAQQVVILLEQRGETTDSMRLRQKYYTLNAADDALADPLRRDESLLLTASGTMKTILTCIQQRDIRRLYRYLAQSDPDTGEARMEYEAFASKWTEYPALTAFDFSGGSASGTRAVFTVSGTRLADGVSQKFTGRSVHLMKTGGLWCISMSQLTAIVEGTP